MSILPIHQRLAQLWTIQSRRELTADEFQEIEHCLTVNASYCWNIALLENMSLLASMTRDDAWLHDICRELEQLQGDQPRPQRQRKRSDESK